MDLKEISSKLLKISDLYAEKFKIQRSDDWHVIKIQEEVGELSAAFLKLSKRARLQEQSVEELRKNLQDEIADVLAMTLLFAQSQGMDAEEAIRKKWFQYLKD